MNFIDKNMAEQATLRNHLIPRPMSRKLKIEETMV